MREFLVGLIVLVMIAVLSLAGTLLLPFLLLLGIFLRFLVGIFVFLLAIWLIGKLTLTAIEYLRKTP